MKYRDECCVSMKRENNSHTIPCNFLHATEGVSNSDEKFVCLDPSLGTSLVSRTLTLTEAATSRGVL